MITLDEVRKAIKMVENPIEWLNCTAVEKQLSKSLEIYQDRNEFDGSLESAIECLKLAEYEIQDSWQEEQDQIEAEGEAKYEFNKENKE